MKAFFLKDEVILVILGGVEMKIYWDLKINAAHFRN